MAENFFCTIGGGQVNEQEEEDDGMKAMASIASGPVFVKSTTTTLFDEENDIRNSRQKKAKVTFAPKKPAPLLTTATDNKDDNFVKKGASNTVDRQKNEKIRKLEDQVSQVYGSKAYKMLQKMSLQKNKKDLIIEAAIATEALHQNQTIGSNEQEIKKKKFTLGEGIGKSNQGILNPVQADLLPNKGGIGYADKPGKSKRQNKNHQNDLEAGETVAATLDMDIHDKAGEQKKEEAAQAQVVRLDAEDKAFLDLFQKNKQEKKKNFRQQYDEMQSKFKVEHGQAEQTDTVGQNESKSLGDTMKRLNIIDMTGSTLQVETSTTRSDRTQASKQSALLLTKILKVKDEAKFNVKALVQREEYQQNLKLHLEQELESLEQATRGSTIVVQEMKDFQNEYEMIKQRFDTEEQASLRAMCSDLSERFPSLYDQNDVSLCFAAKVLKQKLEPFEFAKAKGLTNFETMLAVRNLLTVTSSSSQSLDEYERRDKNKVFMQLAFDQFLIVPLRQYVMGQLQITTKAGLQLKSALLTWSNIMPDQIIRKIVNQIVMPKLQQALKSWSSKADDPLQQWLMPWGELIGKKNMKALFEIMKPQLTPIFSDKKKFKAYGIQRFAPWANVLDRTEIINFANRYVYPKLTSLVKRLEVDPSDQKLEPLELLFAWTKLLPTSYSQAQINCIVKDYLLPKLLLTLKQWLEIVLENDDDAIQEILLWYNGWQSYLLVKNGDIIEKNRAEEIFYLMMLMIDSKISQGS